MDFGKLSTGMKIALISGVVLIINLFLPWYRVDFGIGSVSANAFDAGFLAWFGSLLAIAGAVLLLLKVLGTTEINAGPLKTEQLAFLLAVAGVILVLLRFLTETSSVFLGLFLGIAACAGVAYGAFTEMKAHGMDLDDFKSIGGSGD
ncbi:hypothetical protein HQ535_03065 [bacterium]|nr:hypothetical protein [bacterium]